MIIRVVKMKVVLKWKGGRMQVKFESEDAQGELEVKTTHNQFRTLIAGFETFWEGREWVNENEYVMETSRDWKLLLDALIKVV